MKILTTGATGFIGQHFVRACLARNIFCVALVREHSATDWPYADSMPKINWCSDIQMMATAISSHGITGIVHFASLFLSDHLPHQVAGLVESNINFPTQLLEASRMAGTVQWFLNTGTFWQHYQNEAYRPANLYAASKQAFADILRYYDDTSMVTTSVELNDTYGPNDPRPKLIPTLLRATESIPLSPGEQILQFTYIDDVISGYFEMIRLLECSPNIVRGRAFSLTSPEKHTIKSLVHTIESVLERKLPVTFGARPYREREIMSPWDKGSPIPNWTATTTLFEGIRKTYDSIRTNAI